MRSRLLSVILAVMCYCVVNGQIKLDHVSRSSCLGLSPKLEMKNLWMSDFSFISETHETLLASFNVSTYSIDLYTKDNLLLKSIPLKGVYPINKLGLMYVYNISEKLFDLDEAFELLVYFYEESNFSRSLILFKDNGEIIKNFGDVFADLSYGADGYRLIINSGKFKEDNNLTEELTEFYSIPGKVSAHYGSTGLANATANGFAPMRTSTIKIPYLTVIESILTISTQNGTFKEQRTINGTGNAQIDVAHYTPGVYVYKYNNVTGQFIVR